ncbi:TetR family transcriptional regulator [Weissella koreensis KACC 15510]|uniref:TetR/AcrR family transcriptional regulator n=1 Tax=Weissella koreensis TaxID=165096 RepID=UPI0002175A74|nr:TetR/AcrR family transcriptional regulator [Weissella koreensis]AEJ23610.1 TetR family transcriptional regulator [Weissella koreensis KACC 15510]
MYSHKTNQTKSQIIDAFITILNTKDISKITISDITKEAKINRGTFYRHFDDKFDLINKKEDEILDQTKDILKKYLDDNVTSSSFNTYRTEVLSVLNNNSSFISAMIGENGDLTFETKILTEMYTFSQNNIKYFGIVIDHPTIEQEITLQFLTNGLLGVIKTWLQNTDISIEELSQIIDDIIEKGILNTISNSN